ncbi:uncharacterized protein GLRG_00899 [Colletotrichum graminicola M1.001]|uniref:Uncharacterized protein n=1 Tax=Colletotrichum graminicola (strain M1.001 / M2 / FGSC 10212) TaxID=645133 RepID=E3Q403_COLGM|nr:uncharacterized protein GLRG_00899 [Colletotrichum graminicola M1.001]EFQ25755.1 hypothetical protein GLRG_00899 [Colletotrichum graminicola M1.001]
MKFSLTFFLAGSASAAAIQQRAANDCATFTPFLAPLCAVSALATNLLCPFTPLSLTANICQNIDTACPIHPPTSFIGQLNQPTLKKCRISVFPSFDCTGDSVDSGTLQGTNKTKCIEAPYFGKLVEGGVVSDTLLPFGYKSVKLVCA